jgi:putative ABC transport system permease protein
MLTNFFKIALRTIARNKVYSFINAMGLTLGISCCMVILIFVRYESTFDNGYPLGSKTFRVVQHTKYPEQTLYWGTTAYPLAAALRNDFNDFSTVTQTAGPMDRTFAVESNGTVNRFEEKLVLFVDSLYTSVFETDWLAGDPKSALTHTNSVVLTRSVAEKYFGNPITDFASLLGKTILLNGKDPLAVTGIVKDPAGNVNLKYNLLVPYEFFRGNNQYQSSNWSGNYRGTTFVVLNDVPNHRSNKRSHHGKRNIRNLKTMPVSPISSNHSATFTMKQHTVRCREVTRCHGAFSILLWLSLFLS